MKEMFDDGLNGDGQAGDGIYGNSVLAEGGILQYYFMAENAAAASLLPVRAEHEFFQKPVSISGVLPGQIRLNEIIALNQTGEQDETGSYEDWIEVMNTGDSSLNLFGLFLSDDRAQLQKWPFPQGTNLSPGSFLSIWADNDTSSASLHANFKLSGSGEAVYVSNTLGEMIDSLIFGQQNENVSLARCPDGTGDFAANPLPTKGNPNSCATGIKTLAGKENVLAWFSSPDNIEIRSRTAFTQARLLDVTGRELQTWNGNAVKALSLPVKEKFSALLILQIPGQKGIRLIR